MTTLQEPRYESQVREGAYEVRRYGPRVVAETTVTGGWSHAGNEGFRRLARYIFGKNGRTARIAMTAPVTQAPHGGSEKGATAAMPVSVAKRGDQDAWTVAFTMPEGSTLGSLPVPRDQRVVLRDVAPARVAVVRFSGRWTTANMKEHERGLRRWAGDRGLTILGEAEVNRYDSPFKLWFLRRNEVWFHVFDDAPPS